MTTMWAKYKKYHGKEVIQIIDQKAAANRAKMLIGFECYYKGNRRT